MRCGNKNNAVAILELWPIGYLQLNGQLDDHKCEVNYI